MKKELHIFYTALMFYTRIPAPKSLEYREEYQQKSIRYLPLVGMLVGGLSAMVLIGALYVLPASVSVILSMLTSLLLTGAFHEDGLADVTDGFGGGWDKEKILKIMKDSSIGAYGAIALVVALLLKFQLLVSLVSVSFNGTLQSLFLIALICISGHALSRTIAVTAMINNTYARSDASSKTKSITEQTIKWSDPSILLALILGLVPLVGFIIPFTGLSNLWILGNVVLLFITQVFLKRFFKKWIGGYTGDCLGAIQQVTEIVFYLGLLIILVHWNSIF